MAVSTNLLGSYDFSVLFSSFSPISVGSYVLALCYGDPVTYLFDGFPQTEILEQTATNAPAQVTMTVWDPRDVAGTTVFSVVRPSNTAEFVVWLYEIVGASQIPGDLLPAYGTGNGSQIPILAFGTSIPMSGDVLLLSNGVDKLLLAGGGNLLLAEGVSTAIVGQAIVAASSNPFGYHPYPAGTTMIGAYGPVDSFYFAAASLDFDPQGSVALYWSNNSDQWASVQTLFYAMSTRVPSSYGFASPVTATLMTPGGVPSPSPQIPAQQPVKPLPPKPSPVTVPLPPWIPKSGPYRKNN